MTKSQSYSFRWVQMLIREEIMATQLWLWLLKRVKLYQNDWWYKWLYTFSYFRPRGIVLHLFCLSIYSYSGFEKIVQMLIEKGADVNVVAQHGGNTALIRAAEKGKNGLNCPHWCSSIDLNSYRNNLMFCTILSTLFIRRIWKNCPKTHWKWRWFECSKRWS